MTQVSSQSGYTPAKRAKELIDGLTTTLHSSALPVVLANRDKAIAQATVAISAAERDAIMTVARMFSQLASSGVKTVSTEKAAELIREMLADPDHA